MTFAIPLATTAQEEIQTESMSIHKDYFTMGTTITLPDKDIEGNLFVTASDATNNSNVGQDVFAFTGRYNQDSNIGGNAFVFTGDAEIAGTIEGSLFIFGGTAHIDKKAVIHGNAFVFGGTLTMDGTVEGLLSFNGGTININGKAGGAKLNASTITIGDNAVIGTVLEYNANASFSAAPDAVIQEKKEAKQPEKTEPTPKKPDIPSMIYSWLASIALALVVFYCLKKFSEKTIQKSISCPWSSLGIGALSVIVFPILVIILFIILFGWKMAIATILSFSILLTFAYAFSGIVIGYTIFKYLFKKDRMDWLSIIVGVVVLCLLRLIPYAGIIILILAVLIEAGAMLQVVWIQNHPSEEIPPPSLPAEPITVRENNLK